MPPFGDAGFAQECRVIGPHCRRSRFAGHAEFGGHLVDDLTAVVAQQGREAPQVEERGRHGRVAMFERNVRQFWSEALEQAAREEAAKARVGPGGEDGVEHLDKSDRRKRRPELIGAAGDAPLPALHAQAVIDAVHLRGVGVAGDGRDGAADGKATVTSGWSALPETVV